MVAKWQGTARTRVRGLIVDAEEWAFFAGEARSLPCSAGACADAALDLTLPLTLCLVLVGDGRGLRGKSGFRSGRALCVADNCQYKRVLEYLSRYGIR